MSSLQNGYCENEWIMILLCGQITRSTIIVGRCQLFSFGQKRTQRQPNLSLKNIHYLHHTSQRSPVDRWYPSLGNASRSRASFKWWLCTVNLHKVIILLKCFVTEIVEPFTPVIMLFQWTKADHRNVKRRSVITASQQTHFSLAWHLDEV